MKKILLLILTITLTACAGNADAVTVTFDDEKSNAIRAHYENYLNNDMDGLKSLWSSDLEVYLNSTEAITTDELVVLLQAQHATFDPITMSWGPLGATSQAWPCMRQANGSPRWMSMPSSSAMAFRLSESKSI